MLKELWSEGGWKKGHYKFWFFAILAIYWVSKSIFAYKHGNQVYLHTDSSTEGMTVFAAKHYLQHGFFEHYLLPTYPPFGHDPAGNLRTEPFVYTHYLAFHDIFTALFLKVFGQDALWAVRLVPHTLTVAALGWLTLEFAAWMGSALMGCLFVSMMMLPRSMVEWSYSLHGHSYALLFFVCLSAGMVRLMRKSRREGPVPTADARRQRCFAWALGFSVSFLQMGFDLDWVPVTFLWAVSFVVIMPTLDKRLARRVLAGMLLGGTTALAYQVVISSLHYGSVTWVIDNLLQWVRFRSGTEHVASLGEKLTASDLRLHRVLQEFNRQCLGATAFTAHQLMALSAVFLILARAVRAITPVELKRGIAGVLLAYLAAASWNIVMRQHSMIHIHFIPRHYFTLFMTFALIALPMCYRITVKSRSS